MRLSKRGEYGLRAMIDLAEAHHSGNPVVQIKDIAEREHIPSKFLEQILLNLKNAGLLHSKMGVGGGYYLAHPPSKLHSGRLYASSMVLWRPSAASHRWPTRAAAVRMS